MKECNMILFVERQPGNYRFKTANTPKDTVKIKPKRRMNTRLFSINVMSHNTSNTNVKKVSYNINVVK